MKNKNIILTLIFLFCNLSFLSANEEFDFNVTEIEIKNDGNFFKGLKRGAVTTNNSQLILTADTFEYDKIKNILKAKGNVILEDKIKNYVIESNDITYFKDYEKIFSSGNTKAFVDLKYNISSKNVYLNRITNILESDEKTNIIDDDYTLYETDILYYLINENVFKGKNIKISTNIDKDITVKEFYNFKDGIFNLEKKNFKASDTKINLKKNLFDENRNDPRIYGRSSDKEGAITKINKAIFTSCKLTDNCPAWSIKATKITHDQNKKDVIYDNPILRVYDFPIFYLPKFTHPDPSVRRRSGFLQPHINRSDVLGTSIHTPYFYTISDTADITLKPTTFDSEIYMLHSEYAQITENSNFVADLGLTKGYQIKNQSGQSLEHRNNIGHILSKFTSDLNLENWEESELDFSFNKVTKDTFLKVFDTNLINMNKQIRPSNKDQLQSNFNLFLKRRNLQFKTGFASYENLVGKNSDRYQFILPYYNFSKKLFQNSLGNLNFGSNGNNNLYNTNQFRSSIINNFSIISSDFFSDLGFKNNFDILFKNTNSSKKNNDSNNMSKVKSELMNIFDLKTSIPLIKITDKYINSIEPKMSFRFNPTDMANYSDISRTVNVDNIFDINRLGLDDSFEEGKSLTLGIDYKKESLKDINRYFEFKLAGLLRDENERNIPVSSSLNQRTSNLFGSAKYNLSKNVDMKYNFSLDNDFNTLENNSISLGLSFFPLYQNSISKDLITEDYIENYYRLTTNISFSENNGKMGNSNILSNSTTINFDNFNSLTFNTRRNRRINFTEYYDLVYEYKNDCLVAGVKFKKSYYEDRDLRSSEDLLLTITFFPITQYEQKVKESAWRGDNSVQNLFK